MQRLQEIYREKRADLHRAQTRTSALTSISVGTAPLLIILALFLVLIAMSFGFAEDAHADEQAVEAQVEQLVSQGQKTPASVPASTETKATVDEIASTNTITVAPQALSFNVTFQNVVVGGNYQSVSEMHEAGTTVTFNAGDREGYVFTGWVVQEPVPSGFTIAEPNDENLTFTMPDEAVTIQATWRNIKYIDATFDFGGATGDSITSEGTQAIKNVVTDDNGTKAQLGVGMVISIDAGSKPGFVFDQWAIKAGSTSVTFGEKYSSKTSFTVPDGNISIVAIWKQAYLVTINGGFAGNNSGAGYYGEGQTVKIDAGTNPDSTLRFDGWTVVCDKAVTLTPNVTSAQAEFKMPAGSVTLTAKWTKMGVVSNSTNTTTNFLGGNLTASGSDLAKQVWKSDSDEMKKINDGTNASVRLVTKELSANDVSTSDRSLINAAKGTNTLAYYMDISLYGKVGDDAEKKITDTAQRVTIRLTLANGLLAAPSGYKRTFKIIALHGSQATLLTPTYAYDATTKVGTLTFITDQFSTYALVYTDEKTNGDNNGDNNNNNNNNNNNGDNSNGNNNQVNSGLNSGSNGNGGSSAGGSSAGSSTGDTTTGMNASTAALIMIVFAVLAIAVRRLRKRSC